MGRFEHRRLRVPQKGSGKLLAFGRKQAKNAPKDNLENNSHEEQQDGANGRFYRQNKEGKSYLIATEE